MPNFSFVLLTCLLTGLLAFYAWCQQQVRYHRAKHEGVESFRKYQEQYRDLLEHASDGVFLADAAGKHIEVKQNGCARQGFTRAEILARHLYELIAPEELAAAPLHREVLQQGEILPIERLLVRKHGSRLPAEISARTLPDGRVQSIQRDITERKRAEESLRESEKRFHSLLDNMLEGFAYCKMLFDQGRPQDFVYLEVNRAFETLTGLKDVVGKKVSEVLPGLHESDPELFEICGRVARKGDSDKFETYVESLNRWFSVSTYSPQKDHFVAVFHVILHPKQAEQESKTDTERLAEMVEERTRELGAAQSQLVRQERLATLGQLSGSIGHELRNPLGVISNAVYFLQMAQAGASPKVKEYLRIIENETRNADKIISDLLNFTRLPSTDRERVAVSDLVRQTLERFPVPATVEVTVRLPDRLPLLYVDPRQIIQALGNLVVNACQAMVPPTADSRTDLPEGGHLFITAANKEAGLHIAVRDTGTGISPKNRKLLFEPLFTTKAKGIGLGLAVSKKLVEANGGWIEVRSRVGRGSTFTLVFPDPRGLP